MRALLLLALSASAAAQTPDTTTAARYVPLAVGNEWHYTETAIRTGQPSETADWLYHVTASNAESFQVDVRERRSVGDGAPTDRVFTEQWRHDSASDRLVGAFDAVGRTAATCPLNVPFDDGVLCAPSLYYMIDGGYDEWVRVGEDSVATSRKRFFNPNGSGCAQFNTSATYAAGVGETGFVQIHNDPCSQLFARTVRELRFVRTQEVTLGAPLFPVSSEPAPASGIVLGAPAPNPSSGRSTVTFSLARAASVRLTVIDALGRTVAVLADGERGAGLHRETLTGSLAPGVYVARLHADGAVASRRLTVTR